VTDDDDLPDDLVKQNWDVVRWWARAHEIPDFDDFRGDVFETALQLWRKMPPDGKVPPEKWRGWLWTITGYKLQNAVRKKQSERTKLQHLQRRLPREPQSEDHADEVASRLDLDNGWRLLSALKEPDRSILRRLWWGMSVQEIADELRLNRGQVAMRVTRFHQYFQREGPHPRPRKALDDLRTSIETGES
jgi:RNA polymerase sigma factor (sigma-70 family)